MTLTIDQEIAITRVSKKLKIPFSKVREVFESDFKTMINKTKEFDLDLPETYHVFLIPNFGKFAINYIKAQRQYNGFKNKNSNPQ